MEGERGRGHEKKRRKVEDGDGGKEGAQGCDRPAWWHDYFPWSRETTAFVIADMPDNYINPTTPATFEQPIRKSCRGERCFCFAVYFSPLNSHTWSRQTGEGPLMNNNNERIMWCTSWFCHGTYDSNKQLHGGFASLSDLISCSVLVCVCVCVFVCVPMCSQLMLMGVLWCIVFIIPVSLGSD